LAKKEEKKKTKKKGCNQNPRKPKEKKDFLGDGKREQLTT